MIKSEVYVKNRAWTDFETRLLEVLFGTYFSEVEDLNEFILCFEENILSNIITEKKFETKLLVKTDCCPIAWKFGFFFVSEQTKRWKHTVTDLKKDFKAVHVNFLRSFLWSS